MATSLSLLALVAGLSSCARGPGFEEAVERLESCPEGDGAWREALSVADRETRLDELERVLDERGRACAGRWEPAWAAGGLAMARRDLSAARPRFEEALALAREAGDDVGIARSADDAGWCAYLAGELSLGESLYGEALHAARRAERADLACFVEGNLAGLLVEAGRIAEARDHLEASIAGLEELGLDAEAQNARFNQAVLELEMGDALGAERRLGAILESARLAGDQALVDECAVVLGNLSFAIEEHEEARRWYASVSGLDPAVAAMARVGRGRALLALGDAPAAREAFEAALRAARGVDEPVARVAQTFLAEALRREGRGEDAVRICEGILGAAPGEAPEESGWLARVVLARARADAGDAQGAEALLEESTRLVETEGEGLDPLSEGLRFLRERREPFLALAGLLARSARRDAPARVLELSSRLKARALRHALRGGRDPALSSLSAIQDGLRPGELLLDFLVADREVIVLAVRERDARVVALPVERLALRKSLSALREGLSRGETSRSGVESLSRLLVAPLAPLLDGARRVYLVPDAELALVPFGLLELEGGGPLATRLEMAQLPYAAPPPRWGRFAPRGVLLAGHPRFDEGSRYAELPFAALEISRLAEIWREASPKILAREDFARAAFLASAPGRGVVHVASHAEASTRDPRLCGLVCDGGRRLGVDEISKLDLDGPLVVLSACRTGEGEVVPGEGVLGLGWAFLNAGARGIVTSRWAVDDAGSARLMIGFHERLALGEEPLVALAGAQRAAIDAGVSAAVWGAHALTLSPLASQGGGLAGSAGSDDTAGSARAGQLPGESDEHP